MKLAIALIIPLAAFGQMRDNSQKELTCQDQGYNDRQARHCDLREQTFASPGRMTIDPGRNGGATVKGWLRNDVLVRWRVEAWADTDADANALISQIRVETSGGTISAIGPTEAGHPGWAVSYEIFVPRISDVNVKAYNGGITVSDVEGALQLETANGGIHLARVAGDVKGTTKNGGVHVELMGSSWLGRQLELETKNGGVSVTMPEGYSAHVQAETVNGGVTAEFPVTVTGRIRRQNLDTNLGSGGPLIHVSTTNGGIHLRRG